MHRSNRSHAREDGRNPLISLDATYCASMRDSSLGRALLADLAMAPALPIAGPAPQATPGGKSASRDGAGKPPTHCPSKPSGVAGKVLVADFSEV